MTTAAPDAAPEADLSHKWPARLIEIVDHLAHDLQRDHAPAAARALAERAVLALAKVAGGHPIYLPMGRRLEIALRDQQIWETFNGTNYDALATAHGLCEQQVRKIIEFQKAIAVSKRQRTLL